MVRASCDETRRGSRPVARGLWLFALAAAAAPAWAQPAPPPTEAAPATYDGFRRNSIYVPSQDGVRLAVDVYRPTRKDAPAAGKLPVIYVQMRTDLRGPRFLEGVVRPFTSRGYVVVGQDRRGTGASFGVQKGFVTVDDARDGKAVVEWAAAQPWSNGRVGSVGCSNQGAHQYTLAAQRPKSLVALAPECAAPNFFDTTISQNGVSSFVGGTTPAYDGSCDQPVTLGPPVDADVGPDFPLARAAANEHRCNAKFLGQYQADMHRDTLIPFQRYAPGLVDSAVEHAAAIRASKIGFLNIGGWFDASPASALLAWRLWGGHVVIGPWTHCRDDAPTPDYPAAKIDKIGLQARWYDHFLKGADNGVLDEAPIYYYTMHAPAGTEWRYAAQWPLPSQAPTTYYFGGAGSGGVDSRNDGILTTARPAREARDAYTPDFSAALFDGKYQILSRWWAGDMRSLDRKGLTYTLAPLAEALQVTGHPIARLWVTSSAADEDFFAVLEDVAPDGRSTYVSDGKLRASRLALAPGPARDLPYHPQLAALDRPLSATSPAELVFEFYPTSYVFRPGHRVRVTILNAAGDVFQPPPGRDAARPPNLAIWRDPAHPSAIVLPVIPASSSAYEGRVGARAATLYVSPRGIYLRQGSTWSSFKTVTVLAPGRYRAVGARGAVTVTTSGADGTARLEGAGLSFAGRGV